MNASEIASFGDVLRRERERLLPEIAVFELEGPETLSDVSG